MENENPELKLKRGTELVPLEKMKNIFTAIVKTTEDYDNLMSVTDKIRCNVRLIFERTDDGQNLEKIYRIRIENPDTSEETTVEEICEKAMSDYRSKNGVCHHAYIPVGSKNTRYYLTDKIVVQFRSVQDKKRITKDKHLLDVRNYSDLTWLLEIDDAAGKNPLKIAEEIADSVVYAEPNLISRYHSFSRPSDDLFDRQWYLDAKAQLESHNGIDIVDTADVNVLEAWRQLGNYGIRNITIAVIDDGFEREHPDFFIRDKIHEAEIDYVDRDQNASPGPGDFHGTPCAGVALAEANGEGIVGVAAGCKFLPIRIPFTVDDDLLWRIFDHAGQNAHVISCSWGPPPVYDPLGQLIWDKLHELVQNGGPDQKGCTIVFAAGNFSAPLRDETNNSFIWRDSNNKIRETQGEILNGFATHPDVITVAASTSLNRKAAYSNWGKEISLCAPSNNFHPIDRIQSVPGLGVLAADNERSNAGFTPGSYFTNLFGGTSSAAPVVAGVAALVKSAKSTLTAKEVKQILIESTDKIHDTDPDPVLGDRKGCYDHMDEQGRTFSEWFGYGKVNAGRAVRKAIEWNTSHATTDD